VGWKDFEIVPRPGRVSESTRVMRGGLILAALVATAIVIIALADIRALFTRRYDIIAIFPEAAHLYTDATVWIAGKPAGRVHAIELLPVSADTFALIAVTIRLPRRLQHHVRADGHARLTATRMLGERVVEILPGSAAAPMMQPGDTIDVRVPMKFALLRERMTETRAEFDTLARTLRVIGPAFSARMRQLEPSLRELERARAEAERLRRRFDDGPAAALLHDDDLRLRIRRLQHTAAALRPAFETALGTADGTGREVRHAVDRLLQRADTLAAQLAGLELRLQDPYGFVGRSATDTALVRAWHGTQEALDSLIADVQRNPVRFLRLRF
jgi:phospholipid/cholesterol/gamma-HCH transport system substrate-binding protein